MKKIARIFQECTGLYHYCDEALPYLDARGLGVETKKTAMENAYMAGYTHGIGSGTYKPKRVTALLSMVPSAIEFQRDHGYAASLLPQD